MSTITPAAPAVATATAGASRARTTIVSALLALAAVAVAVVVLWQPWGERDHLSYADLAPHRDGAWLGALIDGLGFAVIGVTLGFVVCLLAATRGATLATVGAILTGFGGVAFCAGMISFASFAWYATSPEAVPVESGSALMSYVEDNPGHVMGPQMAGFLLFTVGSLVLMGALWRSRSVPRWLPIGYLVLTVGVFALNGVVLNVVQAVQTVSLALVGYYAWRAAGRPA